MQMHGDYINWRRYTDFFFQIKAVMAPNGIGSASESDVTSRDTDEQVLDFDDDVLSQFVIIIALCNTCRDL